MVSFILWSRGVQALEESKLDLHTGFLVVQEMLTHWPQIVSFIVSTGQQQEYQLVHGRVNSWSRTLRFDVKYFVFIVFSSYSLQFVYLDELHIGPQIGDIVSFLSSSAELSKREYTSYVFKLCCLCLGLIVPGCRL